jgi:hypothetical protein
MLEATHPWVDNIDRRLFLMGFDAGEEFAAHIGSKECRPSGLESCS